MVSQDLISSSRPGLHAHDDQVVNFFQLLGVLASVKNTPENVPQMLFII